MKFFTSFFTLAILLLSTTIINAQTKWIFHKSHSGTNSSLIADVNNSYGPGMAIPVEFTWPLSSIELQYRTFNDIDYPFVKLDTITKVMRFLDVNDSIIGCNKEYHRYLSQGIVVFDSNTSQFFVYQSDNGNELSQVFIPVTDSLQQWTSSNSIESYEDYIFSEQNERILVKYQYLDYRITQILELPDVIEMEKPLYEKISPKTDDLNMEIQKDIPKEKEIEPIEIEKTTKRKKRKKRSYIISPTVPSNNFPPPTPNKTPLYILVLFTLMTLTFWIIQQRKIRKLNINSI